jgi:hypothetical protein
MNNNSNKYNPINWFNGWEFLKDGIHYEFSFSRIMGLFLLVIVQPAILTFLYLNKSFKDLNNIYQLVVIILPSLVTIILYLLQVLKETKNINLKVGNNELNIIKRYKKNNIEKI